MKVLIAVCYLGQGGGTETHVYTLARSLQRLGVQVGVYTSGGPWTDYLRQRGISVHVDRLAGDDVAAYMKRNRFSVLHVHDGPTLALLSSHSLRDVPIVMTVHGFYYSRGLLRKSAEVSRCVIAVSPAVRSRLLDSGVSAQKIAVIGNGISTSHFRPRQTRLRKALGIPDNAFVIGYAGRFTFTKGESGRQVCRRLKRYSSRHADVYTLVAGRKSNLSVTGNEKVKVLGHLQNMSRFYNACDVVIGSGRVAIEAMCCGVPVLAIGDSKYLGIVQRESVNIASSSNFGDHGPFSLNWTSREMYKDLDHILKHPNIYKSRALQLRPMIVRHFSATRMAKSVFKAYLSAQRT